MNANKDQVIDILNYLAKANAWELAKPLAQFISHSEEISQDFLDNILAMITDTIEKTNNRTKRKALENAREKIQNIKKMEEKEKIDEEGALDALLEEL